MPRPCNLLLAQLSGGLGWLPDLLGLNLASEVIVLDDLGSSTSSNILLLEAQTIPTVVCRFVTCSLQNGLKVSSFYLHYLKRSDFNFSSWLLEAIWHK